MNTGPTVENASRHAAMLKAECERLNARLGALTAANDHMGVIVTAERCAAMRLRYEEAREALERAQAEAGGA